MKDLEINNKNRKSYRLNNWDYGSNGQYFVTICTNRRKPFFGFIEDMKLVTTQIGDFATMCWIRIPDYYPFAELDEFILMPDHLHAILSNLIRPV